MIKFHCKHCSGKIGVKDEYAGRRVRCPKCKEPVRVPAPEPEEDFELEMISPGDGGGGDDFELEMTSPGHGGGGMGGDLAALAAMEAGAEAQIPTHRQRAGSHCPQCGAPSRPGAALCVGCGYNFKTRGKLKTKVQTAAPPAYGAYQPTSSSSYQPNWLDNQLGNTNTFVILLFGCCCWLSFFVGIIGLIVCKDPQARRNAGILVLINVVGIIIGVVRALMAESMGVTP